MHVPKNSIPMLCEQDNVSTVVTVIYIYFSNWKKERTDWLKRPPVENILTHLRIQPKLSPA